MGRMPIKQQHGQQRVVVTGGASGIGRAMVDAFLDSGALVHVADLPGHGDDLPDGVGSTACDVSLPEDVDRLFDDAVTFLGSVDVLCNNVGIAGPTGPVEEVDVEAWDKTMAVNVRSTFLCCRRVAPLMREAGGGVILNTSSTAGVGASVAVGAVVVVVSEDPAASVVVVVSEVPGAVVVVVVAEEGAVVCGGAEASTETSSWRSIMSSRSWMISDRSCSISSSFVSSRPQPEAPRASVAARAAAVTMCRRIAAVFQIVAVEW